MNVRIKKAVCLICIIIMITSGGCVRSNSAKEYPSDPVIEDYNAYFKGMKGAAVFLDGKTGGYRIFNQELAKTPASPNSSFKIISCLMGLESGAIDHLDSTLEWDGTRYAIAEWNRDMD